MTERARRKRTYTQRGIGYRLVLLIVAILAIVSFIAYKSITGSDDSTGSKPNYTVWSYDQEGRRWDANRKPPVCPEPLFLQSPVETARASEILWPGQYRGGDYKAHGGFSFRDYKPDDIRVTMPMDGRIIGASRYLEKSLTGQEEIQYLVTFENECGIQFRFDHLRELTAELQAVMDASPQAVADDTRSQPIDNGRFFGAGTVIATAVGMRNTDTAGMDFGVYDLRKANELSRTFAYAQLHERYGGSDFFGVCWLDLLPPADIARVKNILPLATDDRGASDYCAYAPGGSTLDYNGGRPVLEHSTPNRAR